MTASEKPIREASKAYAKGDFPSAIQMAREVLNADSQSEKNIKKARNIIRAIEIDPAVALVFGITLFVMLFLSIKFLF
jgi:hypothetical protein